MRPLALALSLIVLPACGGGSATAPATESRIELVNSSPEGRAGLPGSRIEFGVVLQEGAPEPNGWEWDFGTGASPAHSELSQPTVVLRDEGAYTGSVRVRWESGWSTPFTFTFKSLGMPTLTGLDVDPTTLREGQYVTLRARGNGLATTWRWRNLARDGISPDVVTSTEQLSLYVPTVDQSWTVHVEAENAVGSTGTQEFVIPVGQSAIDRRGVRLFEGKRFAAGRFGDGIAVVSNELPASGSPNSRGLGVWLLADPLQQSPVWRSALLPSQTTITPIGIQVLDSTVGVLYGLGRTLIVAIQPNLAAIETSDWALVPLTRFEPAGNGGRSDPQLLEHPDHVLAAYVDTDAHLVLASAPAHQAHDGAAWQLLTFPADRQLAPLGHPVVKRDSTRGYLIASATEQSPTLLTFDTGADLARLDTYSQFPLAGLVHGEISPAAYSDAWALIDHEHSQTRLLRIPTLRPMTGSVVETSVLWAGEFDQFFGATVFDDRPLLLTAKVESVPQSYANTYFDLYQGQTATPASPEDWERVTIATEYWTYCKGCIAYTDLSDPRFLPMGDTLFLRMQVSFEQSFEVSQPDISLSRFILR